MGCCCKRIPDTYLQMIDEEQAGVFQGYFSPADRLIRRNGALRRQLEWPDTCGMEWPPFPWSKEMSGRSCRNPPEFTPLNAVAGGPGDPSERAHLSLPAPTSGQGSPRPGDLASEIGNGILAVLGECIPGFGAYLSTIFPAAPGPASVRDRRLPRRGRPRKRRS